MATDNDIETSKSGLNVSAAVFIAIAIACVMVAVTTVIFLRSSAYTTVKQIQIGIKTTESLEHGDLDVTSPINAINIDDYASAINQRLKSVNDANDFGPETISDTALGL
jgi:hypothetical protein